MRALITVVLLGALALPAAAQEQQGKKHRKQQPDSVVDASLIKQRKPLEPAPIFDQSAPLEVTFTANLGQLRRDKGEETPWRAATITYTAANGEKAEVPLRARTRGIWRRKNCAFPPLRLDFAGGKVANTPFANLDRPKLVNYCQPTWTGEQYILQEFQLYRVYALLTPMSHQARLLRVTYADSGSGKQRGTHYGFLLDEPRALADRTKSHPFDIKGVGYEELDPQDAAIFFVFQYMIGNTDWDVANLHNVELFETGSTFHPVAYDFDYAGAINTSYATPDPRLHISSVTERLYRGSCIPDSTLQATFERFNAVRPQIKALYADSLGMLLREDVRVKTMRYFDDFYEVINHPANARDIFGSRCRK